MGNEIKEIFTDNGYMKSTVVCPENITPDTKAFYFTYGKGGADSAFKYIEELVKNENETYVTTMMQTSGIDTSGSVYLDGSKNEWQELTIETMGIVQDECGLETEPILCGFSGGVPQTLKTAAEWAQQNPNLGEQYVLCVDGGNWGTVKFDENDKQALSNSVLVSFAQPTFQKDFDTYMGETGKAILYITLEPPRPGYVDGTNHTDHQEIFFKAGFREYFVGEGKLPGYGENLKIEFGYAYPQDIKLNFKYEIKIDGEIHEVSYDEISDLNKLNNKINILKGGNIGENTDDYSNFKLEEVSIFKEKYSYLSKLENLDIVYSTVTGISSLSNSLITSDLEYINKFTNQMINSIKQEAMNYSSLNVLTTSAACKYLFDVISTYTSMYYDSVGVLLDKLSMEAKAINSIGQAMADMDIYLSNEAETEINTNV